MKHLEFTFKVGFSVRCHKVRRRVRTQKLSMRQFCCWKEGWKENKGQQCKEHVDVRTGCKAMI